MSIIGFSSGGAGHLTNTDRMVQAVLEKSGHELGHALGLGHSEYDNSLMEPYNSVRWGTYGIYYPQQDDINGINTLYYGW